MVLSSLVLVFLLWPYNSFTKEIPKLITKQSPENLRYFTEDGQYTYYQRRNGELLLSTNYNVKAILKEDKNTQFHIKDTQTLKNLLIEVYNSFHKNLNLRKMAKIYIAPIGTTETSYLGTGLNAQLHQKDSWVSYQMTNDHTLNFKLIANPQIGFKLKLSNNHNPYFRPFVVFPKEQDIFYTDIDSQGRPVVIHYKRENKKSTTITKGTSALEKLEICRLKDRLIIGRFGLVQSGVGTTISSVSFDQPDQNKMKTLYNSSYNDIGNMYCSDDDQSIYFIKVLDRELKFSELSQLNVKTKKISLLTDFKYVNQFSTMGRQIFLPFRGEYYVIKGPKNFKKKDLLK